MSPEDRKSALSAHLARSVQIGWRIETQLEFGAVLVEGKKVNHILHFLISVFTCGLWVIPWIIMSVAGGEKRRTILIDENGNIA